MKSTTLDAKISEPTATPAPSALPWWSPRRIAPETVGAALYCLRVFLAVRIGLAILGLAGVALIPIRELIGVPGWDAPHTEPGWANMVTAWERWDALWFLRIASGGYADGDNSAAFFPLYPLVVRGVAAIPPLSLLSDHYSYLGSALLVSNLAFLGAMFVVYKLTLREFDEKTARRSVLYMAIFPTALFFFAPYSESLFLLLAATSLWGARTGRWAIAGTAGALASATRSIGLVLIPALAVEAIRQTLQAPREERTWHAVWSLMWSSIVGAGTLLYLAYWRGRTGEFDVPFSAQGGWLREFSWPWETVVNGTREGFRYLGVTAGGYHLVDWLIVVVALALGLWVVLRAPVSYGVYTGLSLIVPLSFVWGGRPLMSVPRFTITIFPLFWALARFSERWKAHELVVAASAAGLSALTLLFVTYYWIF